MQRIPLWRIPIIRPSGASLKLRPTTVAWSSWLQDLSPFYGVMLITEQPKRGQSSIRRPPSLGGVTPPRSAGVIS